jgi:hypothetical protein
MYISLNLKINECLIKVLQMRLESEAPNNSFRKVTTIGDLTYKPYEPNGNSNKYPHGKVRTSVEDVRI